jgi:hypothetical protein
VRLAAIALVSFCLIFWQPALAASASQLRAGHDGSTGAASATGLYITLDEGDPSGGDPGGADGGDPGGDPGTGGGDPGTGGGEQGGSGDGDPGTGGSNPGGSGDGSPGDGSNPGDGGASGGGNPGGPEKPETEYVTQVLLRNDEAGPDGEKHYVGEDYDPDYKVITIEQKGRTVKLNGYYTTNLGKGALFETANKSNNLGEILLDWKSSDERVATVSPNGLITPGANGTVTITATVRDAAKYQGTAPSKSIEVILDGQEGEYVSEVAIIDEAGNDIGEKWGEVKKFTEKNSYFNFYALVTWVDADGTVIRVEDTRTGEVSSSIEWAIAHAGGNGSDTLATINENTGRFRTTEVQGDGFVFCSVTGGVGSRKTTDTVRFLIDFGEPAYNPSESLTLKVVYEMYPDKVVQEHSYSFGELLGRLATQDHFYTMIGGSHSSGYATIHARGFLFKDVLALEGVKLDEIRALGFGLSDNHDYGDPVSYSYLYDEPRYYFPNWDIGGSQAEAVVVPPILAYSSLEVGGKSEIDGSLPLSSNTRFRLVFGPRMAAETNSSKQLYYIHTITIVLKGAPPISPGGDGNETGGGGGGNKDTGSGVAGSGAAGEDGSDSGRGNERPAAGGVDNDATNETGEGAAGALSTEGGEARSWHVFEMMSKAQSTVAELDLDSPYLVLAGPVALTTVLAGIGFTYGGFRRRLT